MVRDLRVLVIREDKSSLDAARANLEQEGFEVIGARSFIEAAPFIVGTRVDVLLIYLPQIEWRQRAVLNEVRRANAKLPVIAVAPQAAGPISETFADIGIALMPAQVGHSALAEVIREIWSQ